MITRRGFTAGLALASVLAGARQADAADKALPDVIRFGDVGFGFGSPFGEGTSAIADAKGFIADEFKETDTKLEFAYFIGTGPAINEALANKQLDFASYGAVPNVIGKAGGLPTKVLASYGGTNIFAAARPDLPIRSIADLRGKKVAVQKATIIQWGLIRALDAHGLKPSDVTIVDLKNADQIAALAAGSVDAVFGAVFLLPLEAKGLARIIYRSTELGPRGQGFGGFLATDSFLSAYPDATRRVVRGFVRAAAWLSDEANREEAFRIWSRTGTPPELYRANFEGQKLHDLFAPIVDDFLTERYRSVIAFNAEEKLIRRSFDVDSFIDPQPVRRAIADLHLETRWTPRRADGSLPS